MTLWIIVKKIKEVEYDGITNGNFKSVAMDSESNIWFGEYSGGVIRVNANDLLTKSKWQVLLD